MSATSVLFQLQYVHHWRRIEQLQSGLGAQALLAAFQNYAANLASQQNNTYTTPFEVVTPNMGNIQPYNLFKLFTNDLLL